MLRRHEWRKNLIRTNLTVRFGRSIQKQSYFSHPNNPSCSINLYILFSTLYFIKKQLMEPSLLFFCELFYIHESDITLTTLIFNCDCKHQECHTISFSIYFASEKCSSQFPTTLSDSFVQQESQILPTLQVKQTQYIHFLKSCKKQMLLR